MCMTMPFSSTAPLVTSGSPSLQQATAQAPQPVSFGGPINGDVGSNIQQVIQQIAALLQQVTSMMGMPVQSVFPGSAPAQQAPVANAAPAQVNHTLQSLANASTTTSLGGSTLVSAHPTMASDPMTFVFSEPGSTTVGGSAGAANALAGAGATASVAAASGGSAYDAAFGAVLTELRGSTGQKVESPNLKNFLWRGNYYHKIANAGGNTNNLLEVELRVAKSTLIHKIEEEGIQDFAINRVQTRAVDPVADADLLRIDPNAKWVSDVTGTRADGSKEVIPVVTDRDGVTWVDPFLRR